MKNYSLGMKQSEVKSKKPPLKMRAVKRMKYFTGRMEEEIATSSEGEPCEETVVDGGENTSPKKETTSPRKESTMESVFSKGFDENNEFTDWIKHIFKCKACKIFAASKHDPDLCQCGRAKDLHAKVDEEKPVSWSTKVNTEKEPTDAFGHIRFVRQDKSSTGIRGRAEYMRIADDTETNRIALLLQDVWGLKDPQILISVVGGHSSVTLPEELKNSIEMGLGKVLKTADVWILTGGNATGYSRTVAEVFQNAGKRDRLHKNACIGVMPWGCADQKMTLINDGEEVPLPVVSDYHLKKNVRRWLDHNHTHFLLVDNGSLESFKFQHRFRVYLQRYFAERAGRSLPSIIILLKGGISSVSAVHAALKSSPQIPVLVVKGSGRVADVIANAYLDYEALSEQQKRRGGLGVFNDLHRKLAEVRRGGVQDDSTAKAAKMIQECIEDFNDKMIIYDIKKGLGLHQALVQACKACSVGKGQDDMFNRLQLALLWDDLEAAKQKFSSDIANDSLYIMLKKSLVAGKIDIVKVIISQKKVNLNDFLSKEMLQKLYVKKLKGAHSFILKLMTKNEKNHFVKNKRFGLETVDRLVSLLLHEDYTLCYTKRNLRSKVISPVQELLIWSTLSNEREVTQKLLQLEDNYLLINCMLLSRLYCSLSERISDKGESDALQESGEYYSDMAISVLSYYYKYDAESSVLFIKENIPLFRNCNLITLAASMKFKSFVAHPCCQRVLDDKWLGNGLSLSDSWEERLRKAYQQKPRRLSELPRYSETNEIDPGQECCTVFQDILKKNILYLVLVPKGKLILHVFMYATFLILFSYETLINIDSKHGIIRWVLLAFVISFSLDEIRQIAEVKKRSNWQKIKGWAGSIWNFLDFVSLGLFLAGFIAKFYNKDDGRVLESAALAIFYIKVLQFYRTHRILGPYVVMIFRMFRHLMTFLSVLLVGMVAFGVFFTSLLRADNSKSWRVLFSVLYRPFFFIFEELDLEKSLSPNTTVFGTPKINEGQEIVLVLALCLYLLFSSLLLINLLIAIFNNIYEQISRNSNEVWKFEKYDMLQEFWTKPYLPIPFSVLENLFRLVKLGYEACVETTIKREKVLREMDRELLDFERRCIRQYWKEVESKKPVPVDKYVVEMSARLVQQALLMEENQTKIEARLETLELLLQCMLTPNTSKEQMSKAWYTIGKRPTIHRKVQQMMTTLEQGSGPPGYAQDFSDSL